MVIEFVGKQEFLKIFPRVHLEQHRVIMKSLMHWFRFQTVSTPKLPSEWSLCVLLVCIEG
jgi:hypothetical protein